jgi:hypothetical protein
MSFKRGKKVFLGFYCVLYLVINRFIFCNENTTLKIIFPMKHLIPKACKLVLVMPFLASMFISNRMQSQQLCSPALTFTINKPPVTVLRGGQWNAAMNKSFTGSVPGHGTTSYVTENGRQVQQQSGSQTGTQNGSVYFQIPDAVPCRTSCH